MVYGFLTGAPEMGNTMISISHAFGDRWRF
jgi:hypothetical protein